MLNNAKEITKEMLDVYENSFKDDKIGKVMQNACSKTAINTVCFNNNSKIDVENQFSINIKTLPVANQKQSGRCWIFAGTNILREIVSKKCNLDNFELSQNYLAFYDKLEKINYALESIIDLIDKDPDDRTFSLISHFPVGDGGQWDMFKSLIKKYGICPKNVMQETYQSSATRESDNLINTSIRKFASEAKKLYNQKKYEVIRELKNEYLTKLYRLLVIVFGNPAKKFDFEYTDKDGNYHIDKNLNPHTFYDKYVGVNIDDYVSIINAPTKDKPFYDTFTVDYVGNVIGGNPIHYLNLPMDDFKNVVLQSLKDNNPVWFGSDCSKYINRDSGAWDPNQYDYLTGFNLDLYMDKKDMLDFGESAMNHAMVITGVNLNDDKPNRWKIENSWGSDVAHKGYYVATDAWFDRFVFQAVVDIKYLNEKMKEALKKEPHHLNPWDPMGTLA